MLQFMESQGHSSTFFIFAEYICRVDIFLVRMQMHCVYQAGRDSVTLDKGK